MRPPPRLRRQTALTIVGLALAGGAGFAATGTLSSGVIASATTVLATVPNATYTYAPSTTFPAASNSSATSVVTNSCIVYPSSLDGWISQASPLDTTPSPNPASPTVVNGTTAAKATLIQFTALPPTSCPGLASTAEVTQATLQVYAQVGQTTNAAADVVNVQRVTSGWNSSVTWSTRPTVASTTSATVTLNSLLSKAYQVDVTGDVNNLVQGGAWPPHQPLPPYQAGTAQWSNFGWQFSNTSASPATTATFVGGKNTNLRQRPMLVIKYLY